MSDLGTSTTVFINSPRHQVWKAITSPELIKRWFFGVETEADWKVGGALVHRGEWQGKRYEDRGQILQIDPPKRLVHTHWSAFSGRPDRPENYQRVFWTLSEVNRATELTVTEENIPSEDAQAVSDQAWSTALDNLKRLLEGEQASRHVA